MNVHLHVDHLVLEGLPVGGAGGAELGAAVEAELARLLAGTPVAAALQRAGARASVPSAGIVVGGDDTPETLGLRIGRAVHGAISR